VVLAHACSRGKRAVKRVCVCAVLGGGHDGEIEIFIHSERWTKKPYKQKSDTFSIDIFEITENLILVPLKLWDMLG